MAQVDSTLRNSVYNTKNGRYVIGGPTEVSAKYLEWWNKREVDKDPSDILYIMEEKFVGRPDMLGTTFYGDPGLTWVILQYNNLLDPMEELVAGVPVLIPNISKLDSFKSVATTGGTPSTRNGKA